MIGDKQHMRRILGDAKTELSTDQLTYSLMNSTNSPLVLHQPLPIA
jgi:hypothetical protein